MALLENGIFLIKILKLYQMLIVALFGVLLLLKTTNILFLVELIQRSAFEVLKK
jgi:hypothetical protein